MTKTACECCSFPGPMRWLNAGGDLPRPNCIHRGADRALMRSERPPKCLLHSPDLTGVQTPRSNPVSITSTIKVGAAIKSA